MHELSLLALSPRFLDGGLQSVDLGHDFRCEADQIHATLSEFAKMCIGADAGQRYFMAR